MMLLNPVPATWSMIKSAPCPPVAASTSDGQPGLALSTATSAP
ncbi:Uncharacterised protein [Mycobacteroides abscessus subsp. abscessus]|nr:Uncharacterised protein [Mycobacteroides abscessus subsp. abscessus]